MVGRKPKQKKKQLLGSHQRCWLWGRHAVLETIRARRWIPLEIHIDPQVIAPPLAEEIKQIADELGLQGVFKTASPRIIELCHAADHQGFLLKLPPFPYASLANLEQGMCQQRLANQEPFCIMLAGIQDPHNFGAILRSAEVLGVNGVIVPQACQAEVSPQVVRSSAGAANYLTIVQVESLVETIQQLQACQLQVVGASEKGTLPPAEIDFRPGTLLLIGNEGGGLGPELLSACDQLVSIPQSGRINSLNAAVAAGILSYEVQRQRNS